MNLDMAEGMFKKAISDFVDGMRTELLVAKESAANAWKEADINQQIIRRLENELSSIRSILKKSDIDLSRKYRSSVRSGESLVNDALSLLPSLHKIDIPFGFCGIYFLVDGHQITYIGQSVNCAARIGEHTRDDRKTFNNAYLLPCPKTKLNDFEAALIQTYQPRDNGRHKNGNAFCPRLTRPLDAILADIDSCIRINN